MIGSSSRAAVKPLPAAHHYSGPRCFRLLAELVKGGDQNSFDACKAKHYRVADAAFPPFFAISRRSGFIRAGYALAVDRINGDRPKRPAKGSGGGERELGARARPYKCRVIGFGGPGSSFTGGRE